ncbi:hypothetical protein [Pseudoalteromonas sp. L21]|uniref:hypothetical protein n=1 Tax=Pseudoalteromonas sp. L21 TaxID=1539746 RepID=UPI001F32B027|nr:hypothetical protein [Pseudoalteromonas sp. L21]MCF7516664.1 hypothetical protein [Pseudoalteromonas sp. L21]
MNKKELYNKAVGLILSKLDETYPEKIKLHDYELGFYEREDISDERNIRARIMSNAFNQLKKDRLITFSSEPDRSPRLNLVLTEKGLKRPKNPIEAYKEDGVKASISASANAIGKAIIDKLNS